MFGGFSVFASLMKTFAALSGSPMNFDAFISEMCEWTSSYPSICFSQTSVPAFWMFVLNGPGQTAVALIPNGAISSMSVVVIPTSAAFDAL